MNSTPDFVGGKYANSREWLGDLVQLPSINPAGKLNPDPALHGEGRVTAWLEIWAKQKNIPCFRQPVFPDRDNLVLDWNPWKQKKLQKNCAPKTILWEVHQDTVGIDGMCVPPFAGNPIGGKLFGRGSCDVKGTMAAMLSALDRLALEKPPGAPRIILACTVDEEHTFQGVQHLRGPIKGTIQLGEKELCRPDYAVVAEPSSLGLIVAHKGVVRWNLLVEGIACHSSTPWEGSNAITTAGLIVAKISKLLNIIPNGIQNGSICVTQIHGGSAPNVVPGKCEILIDRRLGLGECPIIAENQLRAFLEKEIHPASGTKIVLPPPLIRCPPLRPEGNEKAVLATEKAILSVIGNCLYSQVPFGTDASTLAEHGIPCVVFGPGNIIQAHTRDEWIDLSEVEKAADILFTLAAGYE